MSSQSIYDALVYSKDFLSRLPQNNLVQKTLKKFAEIDINSAKSILQNALKYLENNKQYVFKSLPRASPSFDIYNKYISWLKETIQDINNKAATSVAKPGELENYFNIVYGHFDKMLTELAYDEHFKQIPDFNRLTGFLKTEKDKFSNMMAKDKMLPQREDTDVSFIAKVLASKLQDEVSKSDNDSVISTDKASSPYFRNLDSIFDYIAYLYNEKFKYNGKQIVYKETDALSKERLNELKKVNEYYLEPKGFIESLKDLRYKARQSNDKLFILLVGTLEKEAANKLDLTMPSEKDVNKEKDKRKFNQFLEMTIDRIRNPISPYLQKALEQNGNNEIKGKHLMGGDVFFRDFIRPNNMKIGEYGRMNEAKDVNNDNICQLVNVLYVRANRFNSTAKPEDKQKFEFYFKAVSEYLRPDFNCGISNKDSPEEGNKDDKGNPKEKQDSDKDNKGEKDKGVKEKESLEKLLPFENGGISLKRFEKYLNIFRKRAAQLYTGDKNSELYDNETAFATIKMNIDKVLKIIGQIESTHLTPHGITSDIIPWSASDAHSSATQLLTSFDSNLGEANNFAEAILKLMVQVYGLLRQHHYYDKLYVTDSDISAQNVYYNRYTEGFKQLQRNIVYNAKK